jgi:hypothetical protein
LPVVTVNGGGLRDVATVEAFFAMAILKGRFAHPAVQRAMIMALSMNAGVADSTSRATTVGRGANSGRVVVPHTPLLRQETVAALHAQGATVELTDVSGSDTAYWGALCSLWAQQETFTLVEHDVVLPPGALASLDSCPEPWCSVPSFDWWAHMRDPNLGDFERGVLGRVAWTATFLRANRFRRDAIEAHPDLFTTIPPWCPHWQGLDRASLPRLASRIGQAHVHEHPILHLVGAESEADRGPENNKRAFKYYRWLSKWAPEREELFQLSKEIVSGSGRDDLVFLERKMIAAWAKVVLERLPAGADSIPSGLMVG